MAAHIKHAGAGTWVSVRVRVRVFFSLFDLYLDVCVCESLPVTARLSGFYACV